MLFYLHEIPISNKIASVDVYTNMVPGCWSGKWSVALMIKDSRLSLRDCFIGTCRRWHDEGDNTREYSRIPSAQAFSDKNTSDMADDMWKWFCLPHVILQLPIWGFRRLKAQTTRLLFVRLFRIDNKDSQSWLAFRGTQRWSMVPLTKDELRENDCL